MVSFTSPDRRAESPIEAAADVCETPGSESDLELTQFAPKRADGFGQTSPVVPSCREPILPC